MIALDDITAAVNKHYFRLQRYRQKDDTWTAFMFSRLDRQIMEDIYAKTQYLYDRWQNQEVNAPHQNHAKDTPIDLNMYLFQISRSLGDTGSMLQHLRRSQQRAAIYLAPPLPSSLQQVHADMWRMYKLASACVCLQAQECDKCVDGRCVRAGRSVSAADMSDTSELLHCGINLFPLAHKELRMEMLAAGVRVACSKNIRVRVSWASSGGLTASFRRT